MPHMLTAAQNADVAQSAASRARSALRERIGAGLEAVDPRVEAMWRVAPWLAALSIGCALLVLWTLRHEVPALRLAIWAGLIAAINIVTVRARRRAALPGEPSILRSAYWVVPEAALHAAVWAALPMLAFAGAPVTARLILGGAFGTMIAGAFLLALVPLAAAFWVVALAAALLWVLFLTGAPALAALAYLMIAYCAVVVMGCLIVERLIMRYMRASIEERARSESIALLLKEYEDQGAGWLWQVDAANLLTYVSPRMASLVGRATSQLVGQSFPVLLGWDARLGDALAAHAPFNGIEVTLQTVSGPRVIALSASPVAGPGGEFQGFRGVGSDITEMRRSQERLTHMASIDVLTGLPNRQRMRELLTEAITEAAQSGAPCAILFADLDGFKPVNDTFGHPIGDAVLRTVAERLAEAVGKRGKVGRVGGDEFAIVLEDGSSRRAVEELGFLLIAAIAEPFPIDKNSEVRIGLSIGSAFAPVDGSTVDELLLKADLALYAAKSQGRGTFLHFNAKMQHEAEDRLKLENDLRHALKRNQFVVYYQPVVSAATQQVMGFEALLRWMHPERGVVPPNTFIPIAEENGLIAEIGEWVVRTACHDAMRWPDHIFVSVNLSPRQLVIPALPNSISEAITASRIQPSRLELEVTESVFMSDADGSLDVLRRVRSLGVGIALDDFGTGYSSLGYLNKTIFHTLKIDGSFVRDAGRRSETVSIIRAIVALANSFRMTITAEGVETVADFERMQALGCHKIQGYLFGKPVPHAETLKLVGNSWDFGRKRA
jgi:diguanylate cyclase (GGDEF)-like protein